MSKKVKLPPRVVTIDVKAADLSKITTPKELYPIFSEWHSMLIYGEYKEYNELFSHYNLKDMSELVMIALIRLATPWRSKLPDCYDYIDRVVVELELRGEDVESIMRGLLNAREKDGQNDTR